MGDCVAMEKKPDERINLLDYVHTLQTESTPITRLTTLFRSGFWCPSK